MTSHTSLTKIVTKLAAAAVISLATMGAASDASAQICDVNVAPEHERLVDAADIGRNWESPSPAQVNAVRFRVRPDCNIEILVEFWGSAIVKPGANSTYEATLTRRDARGQIEVLDVVFRFGGGSEVHWIEAQSWYHTAAVRLGRGQPRQAQDALFLR